MNNITIDDERQHYVIHYNDGCGTHGYKNVMGHANQIAQLLKRDDLAFTTQDYGTLSGYEKYRQAIDAWALSPLSNSTYFDPGTTPKVAEVLEQCRRKCSKVRLICGNTETGEPWLDEHGVVGRVGRSFGPLKSPIIVEPGENGGGIILSDCLLAVIDWQTGKFLYRHLLYRAPDLTIQRQDVAKLPWEVLHGNTVAARFKDFGKACAYAAFMCGETVEPRVFQ